MCNVAMSQHTKTGFTCRISDYPDTDSGQIIILWTLLLIRWRYIYIYIYIYRYVLVLTHSLITLALMKQQQEFMCFTRGYKWVAVLCATWPCHNTQRLDLRAESVIILTLTLAQIIILWTLLLIRWRYMYIHVYTYIQVCASSDSLFDYSGSYEAAGTHVFY